MKSIRTIVRPIAFALGLAFVSAPVAAYAEEKPAPVQEKQHQGQKKQRPRIRLRPFQFPMKAEAFGKLVESRIATSRKHLDHMLDKRDLLPGIEAQIKKDFESGVAQVRAAEKRVAADGTVTKDEAKQVNDLAKDLKEKARDKYLGKGKVEKREHREERRERKGS